MRMRTPASDAAVRGTEPGNTVVGRCAFVFIFFFQTFSIISFLMAFQRKIYFVSRAFCRSEGQIFGYTCKRVCVHGDKEGI